MIFDVNEDIPAAGGIGMNEVELEFFRAAGKGPCLVFLREGERLTLTGLGTFSVQQKAERVGRNPRTGAAVKIPPRKVIKFRPTVEIE